MGIGLFLNAWIARYLEPEGFGFISLGLIFGSFVAALCGSGLDSVIVKSLLEQKASTSQIIGNFFIVRLVLGLLTCVGILFYVLFFSQTYSTSSFAILLISFGNLFVSLDTIDSYYQSHLLSKFTVFAKNASFLVISAFRIFLLLNHYSIEWFIASFCVELILSGVFMIISYSYSTKNNFFNFKFDFEFIKDILKNQYLLILGTVLYIIYIKIDQILISTILNAKELGIYSAALKLSEIWFFVPVIVSSSIFPSLIQLKNENENLFLQKIQFFFKASLVIGIIFSFLISVSSSSIISKIYAEKYMSSAIILAIHTWSVIFVAWEYFCSNYLYIEKYTNILFSRILISCIFSICFNIILIPQYGIIGAVVSSLLSHFVMSTISLLFLKKHVIYVKCNLKL